jgi:Icc-related predicted phosphoesterase
MKLIGISDIHGYLVPPSKLSNDFFDALCICGDLIPLNIQSDSESSEIWFKEDFREWCENLPCEKVIFIAGNHDRYLEKMLRRLGSATAVSEYFNWPDKMVFLHDSEYIYKDISEDTVKEVKFYGSPWFPFLPNWAFYKDSKGLAEVFEKIPDCDVLLTHTPGKHMFDTGRVMQYTYGDELGSEELTDVIMRRHIKLWLCGHIHSGNHELSEFTDDKFACYGMKVANVSIKDERYLPTYAPLSVTL